MGFAGVVLVGLVVLVAVLAPLIAPYDPNDQSAMMSFGANAAPALVASVRHGPAWLRRVQPRGPMARPRRWRWGIGAMAIATVIGVTVGGISGYAGGWLDEVLMRTTEFFLVIPVFLVILAVVRLFGILVVGTWLEQVPHLNLMTIIAAARRVRLAADRPVDARGIPAAAAGGIRRGRPAASAAATGTSCCGTCCRMRCHPIIVVVALGVGGAVLAEAMISFLGFGDPNAVSWGQLLFFNYETLKIAPWSSFRAGRRHLHHGAGLQPAGGRPVRRLQPAAAAMNDATLLQVRGLEVEFPGPSAPVRVVDGVNFHVDRDEVLGLVGESGSGKTMSAMSLMRLVPAPGRITAGSIRFDGRTC